MGRTGKINSNEAQVTHVVGVTDKGLNGQPKGKYDNDQKFDIFADPFHTPDKTTSRGLTSPCDTMKTKVSFDEYSSDTSCESALNRVFNKLGQSGQRTSNQDLNWDVDCITPIKLDWKAAMSDDGNYQSSQSVCDSSFTGGQRHVQKKADSSASSSSVGHRYGSHPYLKF